MLPFIAILLTYSILCTSQYVCPSIIGWPTIASLSVAGDPFSSKQCLYYLPADASTDCSGYGTCTKYGLSQAMDRNSVERASMLGILAQYGTGAYAGYGGITNQGYWRLSDLAYFDNFAMCGGNIQTMLCESQSGTCAAAYYTNTSGVCIPCQAGAFSNSSGALVCSICPRGSFSSVASTNCTPCAPGTYANLANASACTACPSGSFSAFPGSYNCTPCFSGSYAPYNNSASCLTCPAGSFCPWSSSINSTICPKGSFSSAGATNCTLCPAGAFASAAGSSSCQRCPGGHYCPAGTSSWARLNCGRGNYCPDGSGSPTPCPFQVLPTGGWGALHVQGPAFLVETAHCLNHCFWNFTSGDGMLSKC